MARLLLHSSWTLLRTCLVQCMWFTEEAGVSFRGRTGSDCCSRSKIARSETRHVSRHSVRPDAETAKQSAQMLQRSHKAHKATNFLSATQWHARDECMSASLWGEQVGVASIRPHTIHTLGCPLDTPRRWTCCALQGTQVFWSVSQGRCRVSSSALVTNRRMKHHSIVLVRRLASARAATLLARFISAIRRQHRHSRVGARHP